MEIIASPWKRWGKHRTYLNGADETRLGFYDHQTGVLAVEVDSARAELEAWVSQNTTERVAAEATHVVVDTAPPIAAVALTRASPRHVLTPDLARTPGPLGSLYGVPGALALEKAATLPAEQAEPWLMGAAGEQAIAATLTGLPAAWFSLHSIPLGDPDSPTGDLDHLVIGPGGVYVINSKHHPGQVVFVKGDMVLVARHAQPYIAAARRDAMTVAVRLSAAVGTPVTVTPVIAFVGADEVVIKFPPRDTLLTTRGQVLDDLTRRRASLDAATAAAIVDVAQRPSTWR
ncbi:nuclease-related domain-containing protein [Pengzhenrongella frigida]|uniref:NERD domain-containing protein n=1 Tax=Pengzhenrongella frigida TaxID=1259133 RepID=A0A4Q5N0F2_9MICO|nr:nuclease-related domain-containing protein [Cellulomonas sp. HLT2-17]RYV51505.1 NERD domain-containing protein [Cellulomonas sp. HLT2-17]